MSQQTHQYHTPTAVTVHCLLCYRSCIEFFPVGEWLHELLLNQHNSWSLSVLAGLLVMVSSELVVLLIVCVGINTGSAQQGELAINT